MGVTDADGRPKPFRRLLGSTGSAIQQSSTVVTFANTHPAKPIVCSAEPVFWHQFCQLLSFDEHSYVQIGNSACFQNAAMSVLRRCVRRSLARAWTVSSAKSLGQKLANS